MIYSFNYKFLQTIMESNHLEKKDVLEALGSSDYVSLNKWLKGKVPMHVTAMLRFCNYYNINVCQFFVDEDGLPSSFVPTKPDENAQLLPTDNHGMKKGPGRGIVETKVVERKISIKAQQEAVNQGLARREEQLRHNSELLEMQNAATNDSSQANSDNEAILRLKLAHANELLRIEREHYAREIKICQEQIELLKQKSV